MTIAYFDCFSGAGGDMIVAALLDAGVEIEAFRAELAKLNLGGHSLDVETVQRRGISAKKLHIGVSPGAPPHRHLGDILAILDAAGLAPQAARWAKDIFTRLGRAEADVHGTALEEVHFHEVGAVDSIVDVIGAAVALDLLGVERIVCSPLPLGRGRVECEHGVLPVPAPATAQLLAGVPTVPGAEAAEMTTPTAAAVLTTLAESFGPAPAMTISAVGYGAGSREFGTAPNVLRVFLGEVSEEGAADSVVELAANLDDCTGEVLGETIERLLAAGCLDAWATPAVMKKSRPAWTLHALCRPGDVAQTERIFFSETTTFGVRRYSCSRSKLHRTTETVETPFGAVRVKLGRRGGRVVTVSPEFADCRSAAEAHGVPVREVLAAAMRTHRQDED